MIIDGKATAAKIRAELKKRVQAMTAVEETACLTLPKLIVISVGNDPASASYIKGKEKAAAEIGIDFEHVKLPEETTTAQLRTMIVLKETDPATTALIVQLPLPKHIDENNIIDFITPGTDADGLTPTNLGRTMMQLDSNVSCTPKGIIRLLKEYSVQLKGKHAVVVGRSNIVGKPIAQLLLNEDCTVTMCHSKTEDLASFTKQADILIVACGQQEMITADYVKEGAVVIDVGIHRTDRGLVGDVCYEEVKEKASAITPVPGGVGPMTVAMLLENVIEIAERKRGLH